MRKAVIIICTLFMITLGGLACWAKEPATPQVKLSEAIDLSLKHSSDLRKSALETEKSEEARQKADDQVSFAPGGDQNPAADAAWYSLLSADLNLQMSKKSYTLEEDRLILEVCQKYWNVQKSLEGVKVKELSLAVAELTSRRVQAMVRLGMTPPDFSAGSSPAAVLASAEGDLAQARSDLAEAQNKLNSDYESFNQLLGLWPEDRPVLVDEAQFEPLPEIDLEQAVQRVLEKSPTVWQAEEKIQLAKFAYEKMWATGQYTSHAVREIEMEQAEIDAASTKDSVRLATRGLYYTALNLEAGIPVAENAVSSAEESLRVAKAQFELGMIKKENLVKSEVALAQARQTLLGLRQQHAYMRLALEKPWAVV